MKWVKIDGESSVLICMNEVQAIAQHGEYLEVSYKVPACDPVENILFDSPAAARDALDELWQAMVADEKMA